MKKVLLLMVMLTIGLASINAQDNLRWGATVGMNSVTSPLPVSTVK